MATIRQIQHFLVLAKELHFAKSANILGITQATLSSEIKKLESSLGFQLFDRSNKWEITLTAAGESFFNSICDIPDMLKNAQKNAAGIARGNAGILSIAISSFIYDYFNLGEVCRIMREKYPAVKLQIYDIMRSPQVAERVRHGKADIGFFTISDPEKQTSGLKYKKLLPIELKLAIPQNHPLAAKKEISAGDLKNCHFILPPREEAPHLRKHLDEIFMQKCQAVPLVPLEVIGFTGIKQFIAAGHGIGFLPELTGKLPKNIVLREVPFQLPRMLIAAHRENNNSPIVRNFMNLLGESR